MPYQPCDFAADPDHPTIGEEMLTYKFLKDNKDSETESHLSHIKFRLRTEPVNEIDVEMIWKVANTPEMIDALFCNLAKFNVMNTQPAGGYIVLFIETEMLQMHERGQDQMIKLWEKHKLGRHFPMAAKLKGHIYRPVRRAFDRVKRAGEEMFIRAFLFDFLRKR